LKKHELKKSLDVKSEMIDKLKQENADMGNVINTEKFKTMKQVEGELRTALTHNKSLIAEVTQRNTEKAQ